MRRSVFGKKINAFLLTCLLFITAHYLYAQNTGFRYIAYYSPEIYNLQPQNWAIQQDKQGIIYIGNNGGVLEYDDVGWRLTEIPNQTVRSLAIDETGTVYIGGRNVIGRLVPNSNGLLEYVSLTDHLSENEKDFGSVWKAHSIGNMVYFRTSKYLFRWNSTAKKLRVWEAGTAFRGSFICNGKLFLYQENVGLMRIIEDSPKLVPGGETFAKKRIYMMAPYDDRRLLIGTEQYGFFLYDFKNPTFTPFPTEADEYLKENRLYHGVGLSVSPGDFALATRSGGLVVIDSNGRLKEIFNKARGLLDEDVKYVFEDSGGNLWLGLNNGIAKVEYHSPISVYDSRNGLSGLVLSVAKDGSNRLYAGTTSGLYSARSEGKFQLMAGITDMCWSILSTSRSLLAATTKGVFVVEDNRKQMLSDLPSFALYKSRKDPNRVWSGTRQGLVSLYFDSGGKPAERRWKLERMFENIDQDVRTIVEDTSGDVWLGTLTGSVLRARFKGDMDHPVVTSFDTAHGLPQGEINVFTVAGFIMVGTARGLYRFDEKTNRFLPDALLGEEFSNGSRDMFRLMEDAEKNIWFHSMPDNFQAVRRSDGTYVINRAPFLRMTATQVNCIYFDPDGYTTWFAAHNGLFRFDTRIKKDYRRSFISLIRMVLVNGNPVFFGTKYNLEHDVKEPFPLFDYKDRNIRLEYAAPFYEDETRTRYSYLLDGYDDQWSDWTNETRKDYTNLDAGTYTFRIRAKNVYEHISKEDVFRFKVLPPWYQTWWAYLFYALTLFLFFNLFIKWRHHRLVKEKKQLEQTVIDRTREIAHKNRQLEEQSEQLKELDESKSRFFANISHEFRTPLTLIMGPLEQILSRRPEKQLKDLVHLMLRNARRLLNLVNQLLELARLDSGKMKLQASEQNIVPFLRSIVMCFESLADQHNIDLTFHQEEKNIPLYFDGEKIEKIITNLLSNAFNYTPPGGKISVSMRTVAETRRFPTRCVEITVRDTGTGIPENQLPHIFDRFYRVEGSHEYKRKGSGIGLALTKELVELHHGEIDVTSDCREGDNRGTEFILRLPMGDSHLRPEDITQAPEVNVISSKPEPLHRHIETVEEVEEENNNDETVESSGEPVASGPKKEEEEKPLILVVDDNADVRSYIRGTLEPYFTVIEAADGKEGILRAKEVLPDLIVSDVMMPQTDGYQLCRTLKNDVLTSHIPIILLTAKVSEESELEGLETGADDYITKPFSPAVLAVRVRNLIDLRRQLQLERKNRMSLQPGEIPVSPIDDEFYKTLQDTLETHLSDPDFNVEALSRLLGMSQATLYRKIQALTGESPIRFIRAFRIKRAAQLLSARAGNVSEVALKVGFIDKSYFAKCFKEQFNRLPSDIHSPETEVLNPESLLPAPRASGQKSPPGRRGQEQDIILVVEDSDDARSYIRQSLETHYRVVEAADGGEGIARAMEIIPDLIVSDVMMPGTDGYELCETLKRDVRTSHIPIVLLTARASEESKILGLETGADDYVTKPFSAAVLQARIRNLIHLRRFLQNKRNRDLTLLPAKIEESELDKEFLKELDTVIGKNLEDSEFNVDQLAGKIYMSSATLYRKVRALTGEVPSEYIRSFRLRRAAQLLKDNFGSVTQVAFEVGFNSRAYFTRCFKEKFHQLPSVYMASG